MAPWTTLKTARLGDLRESILRLCLASNFNRFESDVHQRTYSQQRGSKLGLTRERRGAARGLRGLRGPGRGLRAQVW